MGKGINLKDSAKLYKVAVEINLILLILHYMYGISQMNVKRRKAGVNEGENNLADSFLEIRGV